MSEQFDHDAGLGLGNINELAAAAGGVVGVSGEGASEMARERPEEPGVTKAPDEETPGGGAGAEAPPVGAPAARTVIPPGVMEREGIYDERIREIRARLAAIGNPFALRQQLAEERAGVIEERRVKDDALRLKLADVETRLQKEQDAAQWVAQEKHDLERELARLEKAAA